MAGKVAEHRSKSRENYIDLDDLIEIEAVEADSDQKIQEKRQYCRYVRDDIQASVNESRMPFRRAFRQVRLLDVSAAGCSIRYDKHLKYGDHLHLRFRFDSGRSFEFDCVVANRRSDRRGAIYGLMFHKPNHRPFEEYLLMTGVKLKLNRLAQNE